MHAFHWVVMIGIFFVVAVGISSAAESTVECTPAEAVERLQAGNARYAADEPLHPNTNADRRKETAENGQHPFATVITCSDSRVPVERAFDQGVGDVFVIRVAGNVCDVDEVGSIEYGVDHLGTPVLVVLGHSGCGAVTAVATGAEVHGSIPPLVDNIQPAVETARKAHPDLHGKAIVPEAIKANVWQSINDLMKVSPATRKRVAEGKLRVVGAVYQLNTGKVDWLGEHPDQERLLAYTGGPAHGGGHGATASADHGGEHDRPGHGQAAAGQGSAHGAGEIAFEHEHLIEDSEIAKLKARAAEGDAHAASANLSEDSESHVLLYGCIGMALLMAAGVGSWKMGLFSAMGVGGKLYGGFGVVVLLGLITGLGSYYYISTVSTESHFEGGMLEIEGMASEVARLQNEYILVNMQDPNRAREILERQNELIAEFATDIEAMRKVAPRPSQQQGLKEIGEHVADYSETFEAVVKQQEDIEVTVERMHELAEAVDEQLAEVVHEHQDDLANFIADNVGQQRIMGMLTLVNVLTDAEVDAQSSATAAQGFLLSRDRELIEVAEEHLGKLQADLAHAAELMPTLITDQADLKKDLAALRKLQAEAKEYATQFGHVIEAELTVEADLAWCNAQVRDVDAVAMALAERAEHHADAAASEANIAAEILVAMVLVLGASLAVALTRGITKPVMQAVRSLRVGSEQTTEAASQVSQASQALASGNSEQAASLEETSASLEQMTASTTQSSAGARRAATLAGEANRKADEGTEAMRRMGQAIEEIKKGSDETSKIIKVIDDIAFQTNLLALNAAVEAARAGEAGKGFAVVAEEVRNLAQRSAEAAGNTTSMIEKSVQNSEQGVEIARQVGEVFDEITRGVREVDSLITEIATASEEQANGVQQISTAVAEMDKITQDSAASAEETASSAEELNAQAEELEATVVALTRLIRGASSTETASGSSSPPAAGPSRGDDDSDDRPAWRTESSSRQHA
jgi:methyl-accepting chemotaxis protein